MGDARSSLSAGDVRAAATRLQGEISETPCLHSRTLSQLAGCELYLKFENLQFTASFKERGAFNKMAQLSAADRARGVLAVSAGNHAQAVAYHAERMGIAATIVMPRFASSVKVERTRSFGAEVVLQGDSFEEARVAGLAIAARRGLTLVHPFDDAAIVAGQGTVALEMLVQQPGIDTLVVAIGGGGLIAGMAIAARDLRPDMRICGVQSERFPGVWHAMRVPRSQADAVPAGPRLQAEQAGPAAFACRPGETGGVTIADGIGVQSPGELTLPIVRALVDDVLLVSEDDIEQAILMLLEIEKTVVEGAGAVGLAAVMKHKDRFAGRTVGLVLCGGNIEPLVLAEIIERGMVKSGRLARLSFDVRDVPGALADVAALLGRLGANIDEVRHQRVFSTLSVERVQIEFVVQTRGVQHIGNILEAVRAEGYSVERVG